MTTVLAIIGRLVPWLGLGLATAAVAALYGGWCAALACGAYLIADAWYDSALTTLERFAPPPPPPPPSDRKPR